MTLKFENRVHITYTLEVMGNGIEGLFKCDKNWNPIFSCPEEEAFYNDLMFFPHDTKQIIQTFPLPPIGVCPCGYEQYRYMWAWYSGECPRCGRHYSCNGEEIK